MGDRPVAAGSSTFELIDIQKLLALMGVTPGSRFLDLACGTGKYSIEMAKNIGENGMVYAVDLWREGIDALNREIEARGIGNIRTIVADIRKRLPLEEHAIDVCLTAAILHDLKKADRESTLGEITRVVRPGGKLNVVEFKKIDRGPGPPLEIRMDEGDVEALVAKYGFVKVTGGDVGEFNYLLQYRRV